MSVIRAAAVTGALLALSACQLGSGNNVGSGNSVSSGSSSATSSRTSSSVSCVNDLCRIEVAGDTSGMRLGVFGSGLRIESIEQDAVAVSVGGERARIAAGETAAIGGLAVTVVSAGDRAARIEVRRG